jgi:LysR family transcriptional regulator, glycine cleavage system transcriptional activator
MDWRAMPSLTALRAFAALAATGSFTAAGAALNVSHAAVSQQVRALEDRLGVTLVRRDGRRVALTADGARLAATLDGAFLSIRRAVAELTGADAARPLQVTTTPSFAVSWLMPRISDFRHRHPEIELMLNPTVEIIELAPGGVDVAIRFGEGTWTGLRSELLFETSFVVVGARSLIGDRDITAPEQLLDLPWLQELGTNEISNWLRGRGVLSPKTENVTHLPGYMVLEGMRAGEGITSTARVFVERDVAEGRLVVLFEDLHPTTGYYIVTRPGVMRPPLKAFVAWLRRHARGSGPDSGSAAARRVSTPTTRPDKLR